MKECPNCGAQIADDSLFCMECGSKIPQGNLCPHCGAPINDGDMFCRNCGKRVEDAAKASVAEPGGNVCPHCGASMNDGDMFCRNCGKRVEDAAKASVAEPAGNVCPHCGAPMKESDFFCQNCGKKRLEGRQTSETTFKAQPPKSDIQRPSSNPLRPAPNTQRTTAKPQSPSPPRPPQPSTPNAQHITPNSIPRQTSKRTSKNSTFLPMLIIGGILLLALLGGGGWWYYDSSKAKPTADIRTENKRIAQNESDIAKAEEAEAPDKEAPSTSRKFYDEQIVVGYLANQTFRSNDGFTIRFDGNGRMYSEGNYAGVISVLSFSPASAKIKYGGGVYGDGELRVDIVGSKMQLTDPTDGTVFYQR